MNAMETAVTLLDKPYADALRKLDQNRVEEIRLRLGKEPRVLIQGKERLLSDRVVREEDLLRLLEAASAASAHSAAPAMAEGYLPYRGLRIGLCGTGIVRKGEFVGFRSCSSAAIRIPSQRYGLCESFLPQLLQDGFRSTLIASPPGGGKTTLLRELIRVLSGRGFRLGVVDDRGELGGSDGGRIQMDLGEHTDVLTGLDKYRGALMLLRGMNPQILAMDEVSREEDMRAVEECCACGVELLASVHASGQDDLQRRTLYRRMLDRQIFSWLITISGCGDQRRYLLTRMTG